MIDDKQRLSELRQNPQFFSQVSVQLQRFSENLMI